MLLPSPRAIAVVGASETPGKVGFEILKNLRTEGFGGKVYPVNPKHAEIQGMKAYPSVKEIPGDIDLAIIVIPASAVPTALEECGIKKIPWVVVISAGFGETHTEEGQKLEEDVRAIAQHHDIHLIGPNCLGVLFPHQKINASFAKNLPPSGSVALISQSGAMAVAMLDMSTTHPGDSPLWGQSPIGYSTVISIGNKTALDEADFLAMCAADATTKVIGLYLENVKDGERFLEVASRVTAQKPVVLLKSGVSAYGKRAAASHTGALAGNDAAIDALCAEAGIHRAHNAEEFLDLLLALPLEPPLLSGNVAIVTNAGGPGILATDAASASGLVLPPLSERTATFLRQNLPQTASIGNPIDVIGDADAERFRAAFEACGDDPGIDGLCVLLTPQVMTPCEEIARTLITWSKKYPLMPVTTAFMGGESVGDARQILREGGIPCYETPERAIRALAALRCSTGFQPVCRMGVHAHANGQDARSTHGQDGRATTRKQKAHVILENHTGLLDEETTEKLFALYGIPLPAGEVAATADDAVTIANRIGYPVIAKVSSKEILHKTDVGGIVANLENAEDVRAAFAEIMGNVRGEVPAASIRGILIQKFLPMGSEFIVGILRDPSFGPLIMAGLGGIYTELFKDTSFRIAPVSEVEAYEMLEELKAWKILMGLRGKEQLDVHALATLIATVSTMAMECPKIQELDLNPVLVLVEGITVVDGKVICA